MKKPRAAMSGVFLWRTSVMDHQCPLSLSLSKAPQDGLRGRGSFDFAG